MDSLLSAARQTIQEAQRPPDPEWALRCQQLYRDPEIAKEARVVEATSDQTCARTNRVLAAVFGVRNEQLERQLHATALALAELQGRLKERPPPPVAASESHARCVEAAQKARKNMMESVLEAFETIPRQAYVERKALQVLKDALVRHMHVFISSF